MMVIVVITFVVDVVKAALSGAVKLLINSTDCGDEVLRYAD